MHDTASHLRSILKHCHPLLAAIPAEAAARQPAPGKWSPKEILGHLIDSAANNHQKFVRTIPAAGGVDFVGYAQDAWVATQQYQQADWHLLVDLWRSYNLHLAHVIMHTEPGCLSHLITIDGAGPYRLDFIMSDYVVHTTHHLAAILPELASELRVIDGA